MDNLIRTVSLSDLLRGVVDMEKKTFEKNLKTIAAKSDELAQLIHETGLAAIALVNSSGDTAWGVRLVDALGRKHDKARVVAWLVRFGKFAWNKDKGLIFRKRKDINPATLESFLQQANELPYWDLTPQPQPKVTFDYLSMIESIINKSKKAAEGEEGKVFEEKNTAVLADLKTLFTKYKEVLDSAQ